MDSNAQELSSQEKENLAGEVMESLGEPEKSVEEHGVSSENQDRVKDDLPLYAKERLGKQETRHKREMRELREQIAELQSRLSNPGQDQYNQQANYADQPFQGGTVDEQIHKAVRAALAAQEEQQRQAQEAESRAHVQRKYQEMQNQLDGASSKYEDFDEVVRAQDAPFTGAIRDAVLLINDPALRADVLYKLGKNKDELKRISTLHPFDQAAEVMALSRALKSGEKSNPQTHRPIGNIKANPAISSQLVNENTPVSEIRKRMKAGWK